MSDRIEPGAMIGVLGGGQLGAMFAAAARRLGYRIAVWDPDPDAPALKLADLSLSTLFDHAPSLETFAGSIQAATYEWENVPFAVSESLQRRVPVRPSPLILKTLQNRLEQKTFLSGRGLPVAPFRTVRSSDELAAAAGAIGFPCLCKIATTGYDGKGQWRLENPKDVSLLQKELTGQGRGSLWILEQFLGFEKELSVLVARGTSGDRRVYPTVENAHEAGILKITQAPAQIAPDLAEQAAALAASVVEALDGVGVFCVELFLMPDGRLFVNEVAPRPHNSGHYTLDACSVSQFEQQVRAVCGLPLGEVRLLCPAVMVNLIGDDFRRVIEGDGLQSLLKTPGAKLHVYGKKTVRAGRKMGHVTFLAERWETAWQSAMKLRQSLAAPEQAGSPAHAQG
jgi:5-(carboxyamino)imidazole ribonucleotide synthase